MGAKLKIALFGQFGVGNFGNDGSLSAMIAFLRRAKPEAEITCICHDPVHVAQTYDVRAIAFSGEMQKAGGENVDSPLQHLFRRGVNLWRAWRAARGFDLMIVPGTGILDDFSTKPFGMPYALFRWCAAFRLAGARIAFVSVGAGPIRDGGSRWFLLNAARLAHYRSYRNPQSKAFMESIGLNAANDRVFPDLAFDLPPAAPVKAETAHVGVGVMNYRGWTNNTAEGSELFAAYVGKIAKFVLWLLESGYFVRLLIGETADSEAVHAVLAALGARSHAVSAELAASFADVVAQIEQIDVLVASRFHNIVCALGLGRPAISVGYSPKHEALMREAGLGAFVRDIESFTVDDLISDFQAIKAARSALIDQLALVRREIEKGLTAQEALLLEEVLTPRRAPGGAPQAAPVLPIARVLGGKPGEPAP